ncbi:MAG: hypothetical protein ABI132_04790 [Rhodanobacteraceae bacterium]
MHGQLFTSDFLRDGIRETSGWASAETEFGVFRAAVQKVFVEVQPDFALNEAQTEDEIILPVLKALGWTEHLRQATANSSGRADVPDFLLFASPQAKREALATRQLDRRYRRGALVVEAKRWLRPLDRGDATDHLDPGTPSSQMLRYLSRARAMQTRS